MEISWPGDYGEIHTKILERMKQVLREDTVYPYLKENARHRLEQARYVARATGMTDHSLVHLGGYTWCLFPWLGTRSFRTLRKFLTQNSGRFGISGIEFEGCYYITFRMEKGSDKELMEYMAERVEKHGIDPLSLVSPKELPVFEKYDSFVPAELLRFAYSVDKLNPVEAEARVRDIFREFE